MTFLTFVFTFWQTLEMMLRKLSLCFHALFLLQLLLKYVVSYDQAVGKRSSCSRIVLTTVKYGGNVWRKVTYGNNALALSALNIVQVHARISKICILVRYCFRDLFFSRTLGHTDCSCDSLSHVATSWVEPFFSHSILRIVSISLSFSFNFYDCHLINVEFSYV